MKRPESKLQKDSYTGSLAYYGDNRFPHPQVPDKSLYYARLNKGSRNNNLIYYLDSVLKPCGPDPHQNKATHP